mgnify:FL=1
MKSLNNNNEAIEFAYAMGLRHENETQEEEKNDALGFAYAMGLKRYTEGLGTIERKGRFGRPAAEPKFA